MATAVSNGKADGDKRTRAKKGEGPYTLSFVDGDNKEASRVPGNVQVVKVKDKAGKAKTFSVRSLRPEIIMQLAADGLRRRLDAYLRNNLDDNGGVDALQVASEMYNNIVDGKLYIKAEGGAGGPGRQFDFDFWVSVMGRTAKLRKSPASDAQLSSFKTKLESWKSDERAAKIKQWKTTDPVFALAHKQMVAERDAANLKSKTKDGTGNALADF